MESNKYLSYLVEEIHTTVVATVDDSGLPVTAAIDMMDADENGVYFLTAKGKGLTCPKSRLSVPALLLAAQRKCGKVILSQMPASVASSAIPNVLKGALIFPKSLRSFIRKIACIAVTAMRSVQPELL